MFPSSKKREIRLRNVQKKRDAHAKLLFCKYNLSLFVVLVAVAVVVALSSLISCREVGLAHQNGTSENRECFGPRFQATDNFDRSKLMWVKPMTVLA